MKNIDIYNRSSSILKSMYGEGSQFREGQYEAIEATLTNRRTLVIQKTGWGKSLVYFICSKILKEKNNGITIVVSPLLVLMDNQIEAARKLGLKCDVLNSTVGDRRISIIRQMTSNQLDLVLVTPETLFKDDLNNSLRKINIGLLVIDEAHCISDWGHDFRLDYSNLYKIIGLLPLNIPILATTATANDRVIADLKHQLGDDVYLSRGSLTRESLEIQVIEMHNKAERYAWILQYINDLPGSGIIYCLTRKDCDYLSDFLNSNGIKSRAYYSRGQDEEYINIEVEKLFKNNQIKVIIATIKLGMGYDKGDIGFVIHFQMPNNIVSYYQQIGRAGRDIDRAIIILLSGSEDKEIINYFIDNSFPSEIDSNNIIKAIEQNNGMSIIELSANLNIKKAKIDKALMFLQYEEFVYKSNSKYYLSANKYKYNRSKYEEIKSIRRNEYEKMIELLNIDTCYSKHIVNSLDDFSAKDCCVCSNCLGKDIVNRKVDNKYIDITLKYLDSLSFDIIPRKQWPVTKLTKQVRIKYVNEVGVCLSKYGEVGYGELVKVDRYENNFFSDILLKKSAQILLPKIRDEKIQFITFVPSLRQNLVEDFTKRLASLCGLSYIETLRKKPAKEQKFMENSAHQCENALTSFEILENIVIPNKVILVDDIIRSKWTITVCGYILMENGCNFVLPFALADSSQEELYNE